MHSVKVPCTGITASQLADVIRDELGASCHVKEGPDELKIRQGAFSRAGMVLSHESDGTVVEVQGKGTRLPIPLFYAISKQLNDRGIAARTAAIDTLPRRTQDRAHLPRRGLLQAARRLPRSGRP